MGQFFEAVEPATKMKKIPNSSRRLSRSTFCEH
jgi:hypothetical protein